MNIHNIYKRQNTTHNANRQNPTYNGNGQNRHKTQKTNYNANIVLLQIKAHLTNLVRSVTRICI